MKKILSFILTLLCVFGILGASGLLTKDVKAETIAEGTKIYLSLGVWGQAEAEYRLKCWGNGDQWFDFVNDDNDGNYLVATVTGSGLTGFEAHRYKPGTNFGTWWNKSDPFTYDSSKNLISITAWNNGAETCPTTYSTYNYLSTTTQTVIFATTDMANPHCYAWCTGRKNADWPGVAMTSLDTKYLIDDVQYNLYSCDISISYNKVIFNNNNNNVQSANIENPAENTVYYFGTDYTTESSKKIYNVLTEEFDTSKVNLNKIEFYNSYPVDDGTKALNSWIQYNDTYTIPANPSYSGYKFVGWYNTEGNKVELTAGGTSAQVTADEKYFAHWEQLIQASLQLQYTYHYDEVEDVQYTEQTGYVFFTKKISSGWAGDPVVHVWNSTYNKDVQMTWLYNNAEVTEATFVAYIGTGWTKLKFYNGNERKAANESKEYAISSTTSGFWMNATDSGNYNNWSLGTWESKFEVSVNLKAEKLLFSYIDSNDSNQYTFKLSYNGHTVETDSIQGEEDGKIYSSYDVLGYGTAELTIAVYSGGAKIAERTVSAAQVSAIYQTSKFYDNKTVQTHLAAIIAAAN